MSDIRCPHCRTELPEKATFCAACGRRIEGWSVPQNVTPAGGAPALPGADEATRQMAPTPSLLRAAALSLHKGGGKRSRLPLVAAMLVVAAAGAIAGFFLVRSRLAPRVASTVASPQPPAPQTPAPAATGAPALAQVPAPAPKLPTPNSQLPTTLRRNKVGKRAHVIATAPVPIAPKHHRRKVASAGGGLPHKVVETDSKSMAQKAAQQRQQQQQQQQQRQPPASPASENSQLPTPNSQPASIDADNIRFVVRAHLPQVRTCYDRAFKNASPGGTVEIGFAIDLGGRARNVRTETNTTDSELLAHCLEQRVREWQFPRPVGGDYELIYPFVFAPGS